MQPITACLWFDNRIEEAVNFYMSVFKDGKITDTTTYPEGGPQPKGTILTISFEANGQKFLALNGGPQFKFTEAVSFLIECETQDEIDDYWRNLTAGGGEEGPCGWLKDKYGLSWQVAPRLLLEVWKDKDAAKATRAMAAMMQMKKIDIAAIRKAING